MKFVSYDEETGELRFRVKHFTRWGLSAAVINEATPRARTGGVDDSMDNSDAENIPSESFIKIGGHSFVRITPGSDRKFAKPANTDDESDSMDEADDPGSEDQGGTDETVRQALQALGPTRDVFRHEESAGDMQVRSWRIDDGR